MGKAIIGLGCDPEKVRIQHLGVDVHNIPFRSRVWRRELPLRILLAAGFVEKKGIPYALSALALLRKEMQIEITIIGDARQEAHSQREKIKILETIRNNDMGPIVRLLGFASHRDLMKQAYRHHVFLSPSITAADGDTEGGAPVSLIEMAASGMPIVATRHCDIPNILQERSGGLLTEEKDVEGLASKLRWLTHNSDQWAPLVTGPSPHGNLFRCGGFKVFDLALFTTMWLSK